MKRIGAMMLAAAFGLPAFAQDPPKKADTAKAAEKKTAEGSPEEQLAKAKKEYDAAQRAFAAKRQAATELAKSIYDSDPKADAALAAVDVMSLTGGMFGPDANKIYAEVAKNHFANPKIVKLLPAMARNPQLGETFLEKVLDKNLQICKGIVVVAQVGKRKFAKVNLI